MQKALSRILLALLFPTISFGQFQISKDTLLMGSAFTFTAIHTNKDIANQAVDEAIDEVVRIEHLISSWDKKSETSKINANAGIEKTSVSSELLQLIKRSISISKMSNGYFDISFAAIDGIWQFDGDTSLMPDKEIVKNSTTNIDYQKIILDENNHSVFLSKKGMKIGFGAIGKGYAANQAKKIMLSFNIKSGVINAGGDLITWGKKRNNKPWSIGIANPIDKAQPILYLDITDLAVVTSGDYERFTIIDGERYGHIINPKTGYPVKGVASVTIVASDAEIADALATTIYVLGEKEGLRLVNHLEGIEAIIINSKNEILYSNNIKDNIIDNE